MISRNIKALRQIVLMNPNEKNSRSNQAAVKAV